MRDWEFDISLYSTEQMEVLIQELEYLKMLHESIGIHEGGLNNNIHIRLKSKSWNSDDDTFKVIISY